MHTLPSEEESVGIAPWPLKRSHGAGGERRGGSGAVYLSQQTEFCPGSARLQRALSQRGVLPSWRGYLISVPPSLAWLMPPPRGFVQSWGSLQRELLGGGGVARQTQPGAVGCPGSADDAGISGGVVPCSWSLGGPAGPAKATASLPAGGVMGHWRPELRCGGEHSPILPAGSWRG